MKFEIVIETPLTTAEAWRRLTDWRAHASWVPLTKMIILHESAKSPTLGDKFIGRTGVWPLRFDDLMTVTAFRTPNPSDPESTGFCEVAKTGTLIKGKAWFEVVPRAGQASVIWVEDVVLPAWIERGFGPPVRRFSQFVFRVALTKAMVKD